MAPDLTAAVDAAVGIYSTAPTAYLSALARVPDFGLSDLDDAIAKRRLIRARTMRYSVYTFTPELLHTAVAATQSPATKVNPWRRQLAADYPSLSSAVEETLRHGPLTASAIRAVVDPDKEMGSLFSVLLGLMGAECRIVRAVTEGGWRSNRLTYALWDDWVGPGPLPEADGAMLELAGRYVAAYGPVTEADLRWWTGWTAAESKAVAAVVDLEGTGNASDQLDGLRMLPVWDVLLVAYKHRERLFEPSHAPYIYDRLGNATSVVYDRGSIVGVWDLGKSDDPLHVKVAPLGRWPKRRWVEVEEQVNRIGALIGATDVAVEPVAAPVDLTTAQRNRFLSPLS